MAEITAAMVKELRERTQAGMMDCKKALTEANGDMTLAAEALAKKGLSKVQKAAGKVAAEGAIGAAVDGSVGVLVELNCQTDFVARGEDFQALLALATKTALANQCATAEALNAVAVDGVSLKDRADQLTARSGEKHELRRVALVSGSNLVRSYIHMGARIGVLVEVASNETTNNAVIEFADDITLQVASMSPRYLSKEQVPADVVAKQREILGAQMAEEEAKVIAEPEAFLGRLRQLLIDRATEEGTALSDVDAAVAQALTEDKFRASLETFQREADKVKARPAAQKEKILDGKVAKWLNEVCLLDQLSIKESKKTVAQVQAALGKGTKVVRFERFEVGEGVEKGPTKDFATEVAEMAAQAK